MKIQLIDFGGKSPERAHANDAGLMYSVLSVLQWYRDR